MPAIQMIVTEEEALKQIFRKIDTDNSGTLDHAEVGQFVKLLRPSRYIDMQIQEMDGHDEIAALVREMDADGDGTISFDEFSAWWRAGGHLTAAERKAQAELRRRRYDPEAQLRFIFDQIDVDRSGTLEKDEVRVAAAQLGMELSAKELDDAMHQMDADGSGGVDFPEFLSFWRSSASGASRHKLADAVNIEISLMFEKAQRDDARAAAADAMAAFDRIAPGAMRELFDEIDVDGNGTLDQDELVRFVRRLKPTKVMTPAVVKDMMAAIDSDGDGTVSFEEFSVWWKSGGSMTAAQRLDEATERAGGSLLHALDGLKQSRVARSEAAALATPQYAKELQNIVEVCSV